MPGVRLYFIKKFLRSIKSKANYNNLRGARIGFNKMVRPFNKPLPHFTYSNTMVGSMNAEWIKYRDCNEKKVILYFHGGGYATGSIVTHRAFVSQLAKFSKVSALVVEYRLSPENKYPAPIEDAVFAYNWLLEKGFLPSDIAFSGDSAGGGVTLGALAWLRDNSQTLPACAVVFSPWADLTASGTSLIAKKVIDPMLVYEAFDVWIKAYLGDAPADSPYCSTIFHSLQNFPPLLIQVGDEEMLLDDSIRLEEKAKADGVDVTLQVYPKHFHVFNAFWRILPEANKANKFAGTFFADKLRDKTIEAAIG
jgi:monoterpene epsilon-lactone hydrolase